MRSWAESRGKRLDIPAELTAYVGAAAGRLDEKSGGKEGGRVVRKLVAEWIEAPLQRAMAIDPDSYRKAVAVAFRFTPSSEPPPTDKPFPAPSVDVQFE
jgi:hypothetical protein